MKSNNIILLKALLLSTSRVNAYRHCDDPKKRKKIVGGIIGVIVIYAMIMVYCVATCIGYGQYGIIDSTPVMCALTISIISFVFTIFKTNGYLFNFREYDMLMSLPFKASTVAGCKFLYMYIKSLPWYLSISFAMLIGYGYYARPNFVVYIVWLILTFFLPVIPMLASAFFGFLIARISAGFRKTNIVQTVLTFIFVFFCFGLRFFIDDMFSNDKVEETLGNMSRITGAASKYYLPAGWFSRAVTELSVPDVLLLLGVSIVMFVVIFRIVGSAYRNINSALKSHAAAKKYCMSGQKQRSLVNAIAFKEFKRLTGSTNYMVNGAMGIVLAPIFGIVTLIVGFDKIISFFTKGAPVDASMLQPAIPFIIFFFIGMVATTACSPSLEGKNYWIIQSLPVEMKTVYQGKMLFNIYLTVPFMLFSVLCLCIASKAPVLNTVLYLILGVTLCTYSTTWGCVCGVKHIKLDWENEIEVIKQGAAVAIYMLPNMFVVMGLCVLVVVLGRFINHNLITGIMILITSLLSALSYGRVMKLSKRG